MSIWFAETFIGTGCSKGRCQVRVLLEIFVKGGFRDRKLYVRTCWGMHLILLDLHFYSCDALPSPARKFKVDSTLNVLGPPDGICCLPSCCNSCLKGYDPVLLIFDMGLGELAEIHLKQKLAFLGYLLWWSIRELFYGETNVLSFLLMKISTELVVEGEILIYPLQVCYVEEFWDQGLGPIGAVEVAAQESQVVVFNEEEMGEDASLHEIFPLNFVLANCKCFHPLRHCAVWGKGLVTPHKNVLGYPISKLKIGEVILAEPCAKIFYWFSQELGFVYIRANEQMFCCFPAPAVRTCFIRTV